MHVLAKCRYLVCSRLHVLILWQWSSFECVHQNHLKSMRSHMVGPWLQSFWCNGSGGRRISRVCISSQVTLMLLVWNHVLRTTALGNNILHRYYMLFQRNISRICAHWNWMRYKSLNTTDSSKSLDIITQDHSPRQWGNCFHYRWKQVTIPRTALRWRQSLQNGTGSSNTQEADTVWVLPCSMTCACVDREGQWTMRHRALALLWAPSVDKSQHSH